MKIIAQSTFTVDDIHDILKLASPDLPLGHKLPNGIELHILRAGPISHCFFYLGSKAIGVASMQREKIPTIRPAAHGLRFLQVGLLKEYQGLGILYRTMNVLCERYRIFASPQMTKAGQHMWIERIKLDKKHVYLIYKPTGLQSHKDKLVQFLPIHKGNIKSRIPIAWDGSLLTRLLMVYPSDVLIKRFEVDIKND
jgi:hypothetical protein